ncbi:MAG: hypothetical protein AABX38_03845 [Candidatus Micrarchaeota archaeon]
MKLVRGERVYGNKLLIPDRPNLFQDRTKTSRPIHEEIFRPLLGVEAIGHVEGFSALGGGLEFLEILAKSRRLTELNDIVTTLGQREKLIRNAVVELYRQDKPNDSVEPWYLLLHHAKAVRAIALYYTRAKVRAHAMTVSEKIGQEIDLGDFSVFTGTEQVQLILLGLRPSTPRDGAQRLRGIMMEQGPTSGGHRLRTFESGLPGNWEHLPMKK